MSIDLSGDIIGRLIDLGYHQAEEIILKKQSELLPVFLILEGDGKTTFIAAPWQDEVAKLVILQAVRLQLRRTKAKAYSFISEVWASKQPEGWKEGDPHLPASEAPNRIEKVICMAVIRDGGSRMGCWTIERDEAGKAVALVADEIPLKVEGRTISLFKQ